MLDEVRLSGRLMSGDPAAAATLVERDLALAYFVAAAVAPETHPRNVVEQAFTAIVDQPPQPGEFRAQLLAHLLAGLAAPLTAGADSTSVSPPDPLAGAFLGEDDRWSGWWTEDVRPWSGDSRPATTLVVAALHGLPMALRLILLLTDAAGLSAAQAAEILHCTPAQVTLWGETARTAFVATLDAEVSGGTP
jgi:hypothetical protein